ncbi:hypothetical protein [Achromobacter aegrifaciens]
MMTVAFDLGPERVMLAETAKRIGEAYGLEYRRALDREQRPPIEMWREICSAADRSVQTHGGMGFLSRIMTWACPVLTKTRICLSS